MWQNIPFSISFLQSSTNSPPKNHWYVPLRLISLSYLFAFVGSSKQDPRIHLTDNLKALTRSTYPMQLVQTMKLQMEAQYQGTKLQRTVLWILCGPEPTSAPSWNPVPTELQMNHKLSYQGSTWVTYYLNPATSSSHYIGNY